MKYLISTLIIFCLFCACKRPATFQPDSESITTPEQTRSTGVDLTKAKISTRAPEKSELLVLLESLYSQSVISDINYVKCRNKIQKHELASPLMLISYAEESLSICDTSLLPPPAHYPQLLEMMANIFPFSVVNCESAFIERHDVIENRTIKDILLTVEVQNKKHSDTLIYYDYPEGLIDPSFYKFLNNILAEKAHIKRIYMIRAINQYDLPNERYISPDPSCMVFLSLSEDQALMLQKWTNYLDISYENHNRYYTVTEIRQILNDFMLAGFPVDPELYDSLSIRSRDGLLAGFTPIVAHVRMEQSYESIISILEEKSGGAFNPGQIQVEQDGKAVEISFTFKGTSHSIELLDFTKDIPGIITFVNQILNEKGVNGNFYLLDLEEAGYRYIFLTEDKVNFLNSYQLPEN